MEFKVQDFTSLGHALTSLFGAGIQAAGMERIAGGDINEAYKLALTDGSYVFLKMNKEKNAPFFAAEALGLWAIQETGAIGTPQVFGIGKGSIGGQRRSFLLMEYMEGKKPVRDSWEIFGRQLAAMHRAKTGRFAPGGTFGFVQDNYIGAGSQKNDARDSWVEFFRDCRLEPQFRRAFPYFDAGERKKAGKLLEKMGDILAEPDYPSLLHGDLWAGNVITGNDGKVWLVDPAAYVGHAEADLAMTELFGGFPQAFYKAYQEAAPLQPGYQQRRDVYNLYHLLNHLNLFGQAYFSSVKRILERYAP